MCQPHQRIDDELERSLAHVRLGMRDFVDVFPYVSEDLVYRTAPQSDLPWTAGFWPGQLHLAHQVRKEPAFLEALTGAEQRLARYLDERGGRLDHDAGFQYFLGAAVTAERTGQEDAQVIALRAAEILANRFNATGQFIRAHGWPDSAGETTPWATSNDGPAGRFLADTLMTVPLLYWASRVSGQAHFNQVARAHVETSIEYLLRSDGWVYHGFEVDPQTAQPIGPTTLQGAHAESAWSRAQAWAIYGLALAARQLGEGTLAESASRLALRFFDNCLPTGLAPWDFDLPQGQATIPDASASAIAVSGALYLTSGVIDSVPECATVRDRALGALDSLISHAAITRVDAGQQGLIEHSCYHYPAGRGLRESVAWGDYFYLEALVQASGQPGLYALV